ncbi:MAG TPA: hypothetical protein V6C85_32075 [Allocoleopsis sp.]
MHSPPGELPFKQVFPDGSGYSASKLLPNAHDGVKRMNSQGKNAYSSSID